MCESLFNELKKVLNGLLHSQNDFLICICLIIIVLLYIILLFFAG